MRLVVLALALLSSPAFAQKNTTWLEFTTFHLSQTQEEEEWEIKDSETKQSDETDSWRANSGYPIIGVTHFTKSYVYSIRYFGIFTFFGSFGGDVAVGMRSGTNDFGLYTWMNFQGSSSEDKTSGGGTESESKTYDANRSIDVGPYFRTISDNMEFIGRFLYSLDKNEDQDSKEETKGFDLHLIGNFVAPLHKRLSYVGGAALYYEILNDGERESGTTESKLKDGKSLTMEVSLLGLRSHF